LVHGLRLLNRRLLILRSLLTVPLLGRLNGLSVIRLSRRYLLRGHRVTRIRHPLWSNWIPRAGWSLLHWGLLNGSLLNRGLLIRHSLIHRRWRYRLLVLGLLLNRWLLILRSLLTISLLDWLNRLSVIRLPWLNWLTILLTILLLNRRLLILLLVRRRWLRHLVYVGINLPSNTLSHALHQRGGVLRWLLTGL